MENTCRGAVFLQTLKPQFYRKNVHHWKYILIIFQTSIKFQISLQIPFNW